MCDITCISSKIHQYWKAILLVMNTQWKTAKCPQISDKEGQESIQPDATFVVMTAAITPIFQLLSPCCLLSYLGNTDTAHAPARLVVQTNSDSRTQGFQTLIRLSAVATAVPLRSQLDPPPLHRPPLRSHVDDIASRKQSRSWEWAKTRWGCGYEASLYLNVCLHLDGSTRPKNINYPAWLLTDLTLHLERRRKRASCLRGISNVVQTQKNSPFCPSHHSRRNIVQCFSAAVVDRDVWNIAPLF